VHAILLPTLLAVQNGPQTGAACAAASAPALCGEFLTFYCSYSTEA
jgi:hypothetical protein